MNPFDKLMALGLKRAAAIVGKTVTVGSAVDVQATGVSPIRREERFDAKGNQVWVDVGDIVVARENWPAGQPEPKSGAVVILPDGRRYRLGAVTSTEVMLSLNFTSLY